MKTKSKNELPGFLQEVIKRYPKVWKSFDSLGNSITELPKGIDKKSQHLVKLGVAIGAGHEGAVHSHARRAREAGFTNEQIYHAALLAITTAGWPAAIAALSWINDELKDMKRKKTA